MRWYVFLFTVLCVIGLLRASLVVADNGPHNESFVSDTASCATCHQSHTAPGSSLLRSDSQYDVCIACHDGTGAKTNVTDGVYLDDTHENEGLRGGGSGSNPSGDAVFKYRHRTYGVSGCLECHVAHGTSATMGAYSGTVAWPDGDGPPGNARSYLLHSNNRGVCTRCHVM